MSQAQAETGGLADAYKVRLELPDGTGSDLGHPCDG